MGMERVMKALSAVRLASLLGSSLPASSSSTVSAPIRWPRRAEGARLRTPHFKAELSSLVSKVKSL